MPRPKRTKIGPSRPAARAAQAPAPAHASKAVAEDISDEEGAAMTTTRGTNTRQAVQAVIKEDRGRRRSLRGIGIRNAEAIEDARKKRDAAMARLEAENDPTLSSVQAPQSSGDRVSSPEVEIGRRAPVQNSTLSFSNFRRRARQPSILGRAISRARSSSIDSNLAETEGLTSTRAMDNSIAPRGQFRRRERQPSILGRALSRARSSSIGFGMDTPGPRHAESSDLDLGSSKMQDEQEDYVSGGEDDFNPDDESTPLNQARTRSTTERTNTTSSASNSRKRKLSSLQPPASSPPPGPAEEAAPSDIYSASPAPLASIEQDIRATTPSHSDTMMAPPQSSSPLSSPPQLLPPAQPSATTAAARPTRRATRQVLAPPSDDDLPSSPPSLVHSPEPERRHQPQRGEARAAAKLKPLPAVLPSVELEALLPRRRRRQHNAPRDEFEIESSESEREVDVSRLGSDDDELTHASLPSRARRNTRARSRSVALPSRVRKLKAGANTKASAAAAASGAAGAKRTYGSKRPATTSDKENEPSGVSEFVGDGDEEEADPDDSLAPIADSVEEMEDSQELEQRVGKELKQAKRKFEVVDRWELEFEDVTASSDSRGWTDAR